MIKNRKLTLEQRIARLERLLKGNVSTANRKNESESAMMANKLKMLLEREGVYDPVVTPVSDCKVNVELDWDYYGIAEFHIAKEEDYYRVTDNDTENILFNTLQEVASYIAEIEEETLDD